MIQNLLFYNIRTRLNIFVMMVLLFNDADRNAQCVTVLITLNSFFIIVHVFLHLCDPYKWEQTIDANMTYFPAKLICGQKKKM